MSSRRLVVVDVDMGCDDAVALMLLLRPQSSVDIIAITTVAGNVGAKQAAKNASVVLKAFERTEIPFYEGSAGPLLANQELQLWPGHGSDGLGDSGLSETADCPEPQSAHAVTALIDIFKGKPGQIELLALGPLTNIAMAARLDPSFPSRVKHLTIMGGCEGARGNSSMTAEFNFFADPEAAHIVLDVFTRDKLLPVSPTPTLLSPPLPHPPAPAPS
jgi:purine nucleosidase